eukprot:TRINITY_DN74733_c0_g1_i1.p1 TRINITY_DN74733_c0_g1~~TRINITY_DN74733_c0_g1_i1.p1  ORF type:complete len:320 (-),score=11.60 TRINITY_DN74733_c0_g1_i1:167-1126(-)
MHITRNAGSWHARFRTNNFLFGVLAAIVLAVSWTTSPCCISNASQNHQSVLAIGFFDFRGTCSPRRRTRICRSYAQELPDMEVGPLHGHNHTCTLIYLHAFSRSGWHDYQGEDGLAWPWTARDQCIPGLRVVMPTANTIPQPWGEATSAWYSYASECSNDVGDPGTLTATYRRLTNLISEESARLGGRGDRVFLGGLSQGCTAALDFYIRYAAQLDLGGFVGSLGFVPSDLHGFFGSTDATKSFIDSDSQCRRPIWLLCATDDEIEVPWKSLVEPSLRQVEDRLPGLTLQTVCGRGHAIGDWEAQFLCDYWRAHASDGQ